MKNQYKEDLEKAIILLEESLYFINNVPNSSRKVKSFTDSYELASEIGRYLKQIQNDTTTQS